jgi:transposase
VNKPEIPVREYLHAFLSVGVERGSVPRHWLKRRKIKAVIPSTATQRRPYPLDQKIYRRRNVIERMFRKLKNWRRIATRYDRHAQNYLSGLALAAVMCQWL